MAKTLYWNGASDVQISNENKKTSKRVGIASIGSVFSAKKEGLVRIIKTCAGNSVGVSLNEWDRFMSIHDSEQAREGVTLLMMPNL
jgi:hypothetical protein